MTQNADDRVIIQLTSCPGYYGYRLKIHRVTGDLLAVVRAEYASHQASHNECSDIRTEFAGVDFRNVDDLQFVPCPYCGSRPGEACVEDCPQYPVTFDDDGHPVADPQVLADFKAGRSSAGRATPTWVVRRDRESRVNERPLPIHGVCPVCGQTARQVLPHVVDPAPIQWSHGVTEFPMSYVDEFRLLPCGHKVGSLAVDRSVDPPEWHIFMDRSGADEWLRSKANL